MTKHQAIELSRRIVRKIMTPGGSCEMAHRVTLVDKNNRELCGWGAKPLADAIAEILVAVEEAKQ